MQKIESNFCKLFLSFCVLFPLIRAKTYSFATSLSIPQACVGFIDSFTNTWDLQFNRGSDRLSREVTLGRDTTRCWFPSICASEWPCKDKTFLRDENRTEDPGVVGHLHYRHSLKFFPNILSCKAELEHAMILFSHKQSRSIVL